MWVIERDYGPQTGNPGTGYDAVGNRQSRVVTLSPAVGGYGTQSATYNAKDWLNSSTYDNNGNTRVEALPNLAAMPNAPVSPTTGQPDVYDFENRLIQRSDGTTTIQVVYDGDGNRMWKSVSGAGGGTRYYLVDNRNPSGYAQVLEELVPNGSALEVTRVYNYGTALISQMQTGGGTIYYGYDGHGNVRFLMDATGAVTDTYTYDAFGVLLGRTGNTANNYLYCGEQYDFDLGTYHLRARYMNPNTGRFWTMDTYEGQNEDPLSLHKYLYGWDNPVNVTDPSGHDGDLGSLMMSTSIGAGLDSMYNGGVLVAYNSMQHTIIGVQNGQTANAIFGSYLEDVAIGVGIGIGVGMVADIAGDLVYGGNVEGETVSIEVNTPTFGGSQNFARTESTTEGLMGAAARAAKAVEQEPQPVWGTKVHTEFSKDVKAMGLNSEVSYKGGKPDVYGKDSVRLDAVKGPKNAPEAVYDLKTGKQGLTKARIQQIRDNLPPGYQDKPIIEIRP